MDEYQEVFGTAEETLPSAEGEQVREDAGPAPETGGQAQEIAAPATEGAGEETSGQEESAEDAARERHRQAQLRRQWEEQDRRSAMQAERDKIYADIFDGQVNPFTGRPITSEADYQAWRQEKTQRDAQLQRRQAEQQLSRAGLPADTLRQMVRQEVENHPAVMQARQATMAAAMERAKTVRERAAGAIQKSIQAIGREFPEIRSLDDIAKLPTAGRFNELVQKGLALEDAFYLANRQELDQRHRAASRQAAINAAQGKRHLSAGLAREAGEAVEVPADMAESYREMMPGATDAEIRTAYARYLKSIGKQ